jgi:flavin-dependent dehydrogenase
MPRDRCDVCVVGGGPAGSATALVLARLGRRVALFNASAFDTPRFGETLPPEVTPLLRSLGLWDAFLGTRPLESPGTVSRWGNGEPLAQDFVRNVHGCGWHVDRRRFDEAIWNGAAAAGVTQYAGVRVGRCEPDDEGWAVDGMRCRFLVDASGKHGHAPDGGRREREDSLVAVAVRAEHDARRSPDLRTYVESVPNGWWYSAPVPGSETVAMFFTDGVTYAERGVVLGEELRHAPLTAARLADARIVQRAVLHAPSAIRGELTAPGWMAVGDSAASYDPLSGFGIFKALRYAETAAHAIHRQLDGEATAVDRYQELVRREFREYQAQRAAFYTAERRWPDSGFWQRRGVTGA